jgi:hypothetical protein
VVVVVVAAGAVAVAVAAHPAEAHQAVPEAQAAAEV